MAGGMDPEDWTELRALGHRMLDDMFDYVAGIRGRPVWERMPDSLRQELRSSCPVHRKARRQPTRPCGASSFLT